MKPLCSANTQAAVHRWDTIWMKTATLIVNESGSTEAVKIIFQMFADGHGYSELSSSDSNAHGYKTKRGRTNVPGRTALYEILSNEKYTGVFCVQLRQRQEQTGNEITTSKRTATSALKVAVLQSSGKSCLHRCSGIKAKNKRNAGRYHSKEFYLLTGKLVGDVCGKRMIGNLAIFREK